MTEQEIYQMVKSCGLPSAYHHFEEGVAPNPPFVVYLFPGTNNFGADNVVYKSINELDIELYSDKKDIASEKKIEAVLREHGFFYEKSETYIETEKLYEVIYEMEVIINE
jgi:hypothetical protein